MPESLESAAFVTESTAIDEEGKLNVLFASGEALKALGMSDEQVASLFDWMDPDGVARAEGAESEYYQARRPPHRCKDAPVESLEELLLLRGFNLADYLGEDANHNGHLDPEEDDGQLRYPPDNADRQLRQGWLDLLTCHGSGTINLNTAPQAVLETLPLSGGAAERIVAFRRFEDSSSGSLAEHAFRSVEDIEQLQGLTESDVEVLQSVATFRSTHFRIFACSRHLQTGLRYQIEVLVRMTDDGPEILHWKVGT